MSIMMQQPAAAALVAALGLGLASCSTVESVDLTKATDSTARRDAYINYSVAKSIFTIQVTAASAGSAAAGGGGSGASATAAATPPTSWTLNGTITAAGGAGGAGGPGGGGATDSTTCGALAAEYAAAQARVAAEISTYAGVRARLSTLAAKVMAKGDTPNKIAKDAQAYVAAVTQDSYLQLFTVNADADSGAPAKAPPEAAKTGPDQAGDASTASGIPTEAAPNHADQAAADASKLKIYSIIMQDCPPAVSVSIQQAVAPDISRTFALKALNNPFYTDALALTTDANGFLTSGSPSSVSQVPAILSSVASDIGMFAPVSNIPEAAAGAVAAGHGGAAAPAPGGRRKLPKPKPPAGPACRAEKVKGLNNQLKALAACKTTDVTAAAYLAGQVLIRLTTPGALPNLPAAALPMTIYASMADLPASPGAPSGTKATDVGQAITARLTKYNVTLYLDCSPRTAKHFDDGVPETPVDGNDYQHPNPDTGVYDGLIVSASRACRFQAWQARPMTGKLLLAQNFLWAQDSRYLVRLPTQRGLLVARTVTYNFASGQATGVTDSRPSEVQAWVALPGTIVGSFFTGLSSAVTNGQTINGAKSANLTAQTAYWNAQAAALTAKHTLTNEQQGVFPSPGGSSGN